jgi:UPF0755 protein
MKRSSFFIIVVLLVLLISSAASFLYASAPTGKEGVFRIAAGESSAAIIGRLKDEGFIRSKTLFRVSLKRSGHEKDIQPGDYDLSDAATLDDIIAKMVSGGIAANEVTLKVLEGWNLKDVAEQLKALGLIKDEQELYRLTGEPAGDYRTRGNFPFPDLRTSYPSMADKPSWATLEGYLFPDTYRLFKDATPEDAIKKMLGNFESKMSPEMRSAIAARGRTVFETVVMASIVEREVRGDEDRAMVADLFWRRLKIGMALQADSTVNYATGKSLPGVTAKDIEVESGYNTYKYRGLPIGPIGNPGLSALQAATKPKANDYWYFLTDKDGNVHYAKTFDEHIRNKRRYL